MFSLLLLHNIFRYGILLICLLISDISADQPTLFPTSIPSNIIQLTMTPTVKPSSLRTSSPTSIHNLRSCPSQLSGIPTQMTILFSQKNMSAPWNMPGMKCAFNDGECGVGQLICGGTSPEAYKYNGSMYQKYCYLFNPDTIGNDHYIQPVNSNGKLCSCPTAGVFNFSMNPPTYLYNYTDGIEYYRLCDYFTPPPTMIPTSLPSSLRPSTLPSILPSDMPTELPTVYPTSVPSTLPSPPPSESPTIQPTLTPSEAPTAPPSRLPSLLPTTIPSLAPSEIPTVGPSGSASRIPSFIPTANPTCVPSELPTAIPSSFTPTSVPSTSPSLAPTTFPTKISTEYRIDQNILGCMSTAPPYMSQAAQNVFIHAAAKVLNASSTDQIQLLSILPIPSGIEVIYIANYYYFEGTPDLSTVRILLASNFSTQLRALSLELSVPIAESCGADVQLLPPVVSVVIGPVAATSSPTAAPTLRTTGTFSGLATQDSSSQSTDVMVAVVITVGVVVAVGLTSAIWFLYFASKSPVTPSNVRVLADDEVEWPEGLFDPDTMSAQSSLKKERDNVPPVTWASRQQQDPYMRTI